MSATLNGKSGQRDFPPTRPRFAAERTAGGKLDQAAETTSYLPMDVDSSSAGSLTDSSVGDPSGNTVSDLSTLVAGPRKLTCSVKCCGQYSRTKDIRRGFVNSYQLQFQPCTARRPDKDLDPLCIAFRGRFLPEPQTKKQKA